MLKVIGTITFVVLAAFLAMLINMGITDALIRDPCAYHSAGEQSALFNFFFEISSDTGYHPEPTRVNIVFTLLIGACIGWYVSWLVFRQRSTSTEKGQAILGIIEVAMSLFS